MNKDICKTKKNHQKEILLDEMRNDFISGNSLYSVKKKLYDGEYETLKKWTGKYPTKATFGDWLYEAYDTCKIENEEERNKQKSLMYERYLELYRQSVENNNLTNAKNVLDSMSKLLGLNEADKIETTNTVYEIKMI